jgi:chromosome segregation ATPase
MGYNLIACNFPFSGEVFMNNEQLEKRIKWLDDERRKDRSIISDLEDRIHDLESKLKTYDDKDREFESDLTRLRTTVSKVDGFEENLDSFQAERKKAHKDQEKLFRGWITDAKKDLRTQLRGVETQQKKLIEEIKRIKELEKQMDTRIDEETRFNASLREMEKNAEDIKKEYKEYQRETKSTKVERQKEIKRLTDVQGEQDALRKRVDEVRGILDLVNSDYQKMKTRIQDLESVRRELKKNQEEFIEETNLKSTERETTWKNWMIQVEGIEKQAKVLDEQVSSLDITHRGIKRMQDELKDLSSLLDRRVNEMSEMQRLADEKFRAEWNTFTADDQKRWTNHSLSQKEQSKLLERKNKESQERITVLEDGLQDIEDQLSQISKYSESQLQGMLTMLREWAGEFEQIMDGFR